MRRQSHDPREGRIVRCDIEVTCPCRRPARRRAPPRTQLPRRQRTRLASVENDPQRARRRLAAVVAPADGHVGRPVAGIGQPEAAHLTGVAAGVERRDPVAVRSCRRERVHPGEETVGRTRVGGHLNVFGMAVGMELEPPSPSPEPTPSKALAGLPSARSSELKCHVRSAKTRSPLRVGSLPCRPRRESTPFGSYSSCSPCARIPAAPHRLRARQARRAGGRRGSSGLCALRGRECDCSANMAASRAGM